MRHALNPTSFAPTMASAPPATDIRPFTPHIQGISAWRLRDISRTPLGKGIPIAMPRGKTSSASTMSLVQSGHGRTRFRTEESASA